MGGLALKHLNVERKGAEDYFKLVEEVQTLCSIIAKRCAVVPAYSKKETFGDMDVLIVVKPDVKDLREALHSLFEPRDIKHNANCYSLDYSNFQIDVLTVADDTFDCALTYFSFNDLGNLMGRVAHKQGLKYGHLGLSIPVRVKETHELGEVFLTKDPKAIFTYLGYNYDRFLQGFETLEDIFRYTTTSPFFNKESYALENLNHINRTRNRKRPTFMAFVKWLEEHPELQSYLYNDDKTEYVNKALRTFNKHLEYFTLLQEAKKKEYIKSKFNGELVTAVTGLEKEELGKFIVKFKSTFLSQQQFEEWVFSSSCEEIIGNIKDVLEGR